jgi:hypothetical protein
MKTGRTITWIVALIALLAIVRYAAGVLAPVLHVSPGVAMIGLMLALYFLLSPVLTASQKRQEEHELAELAAAENLDAASVNRVRAAREDARSRARRAVRIGVAWVNVPILPIMLGPVAFAQYVLGVENNWVLGLMLPREIVQGGARESWLEPGALRRLGSQRSTISLIIQGNRLGNMALHVGDGSCAKEFKDGAPYLFGSATYTVKMDRNPQSRIQVEVG